MIFSGKEILDKFFFIVEDNDLFSYFITKIGDEDINDIKNKYSLKMEEIYKRKFTNLKISNIFLYPKKIINNYENIEDSKIINYIENNKSIFHLKGNIVGNQKSLWLTPGISINKLKNGIPQFKINNNPIDSLYYFEMTIGRRKRPDWNRSYCAIGFYFTNPLNYYNIDKMPAVGWNNSIGYHSDDGIIYNSSSNNGIKFDLYFEDDTIGAGIYVNDNKVKFFFYKHPSKFVILSEQEFPASTIFYPTFDIDYPNLVEINYGQNDFKVEKIPDMGVINYKNKDIIIDDY